jgi:hypothetical protein
MTGHSHHFASAAPPRIKMGAKDSSLRERAQKCRINLEGCDCMAWPGTTSALDPSSRRAGSCFNLGVAAREVSTIRVRNRTDKYFDLVLFFRCYGQLEKTRPRAIASPPSALSQVPKADENDCRLGRP